MQQMGAGKPTVYDIARQVGTSVSTVSRVLSGSSRVNQETRDAILEAASRLGYSQRRVRRPVGRSILNIVVFLPRAPEPQGHLFYDVAALFEGIEDGCAESRAHTIASLNGSAYSLRGERVGDIDGCIFAFSAPDPSTRRMLKERRIPTVVINRVDRDFAYFVNDYELGMGELCEEVSRRRPEGLVGFVGVRQAGPVGRYRRDAFRRRCGRLESPGVHEFGSAESISLRDVQELLDHGYRTIMCVNDLTAVAVRERLLLLGVRVPDDVGLTGYDAAPVRGLLSLDLTTVDLGVQELGKRSAACLVESILARERPSGGTRVPGVLLPGDSL